MKNLLVKNARLILPGGAADCGSLLIENDRIAEISDGEDNFAADTEIDLAGATVFPGFIDIHNHGAVGVDVNRASDIDLRRVSKFLAANGVTAWLPTLVPDETDVYEKAIDAIDRLMRAQQSEAQNSEAAQGAGARVLGVHYEGVFANEKMCGALRPQYFRTFKNGNEAADLPRLKSPGAIHYTTLAPEIENGIELIKQLVKQDWTISIGHTRADAIILNRALAAGATNVTHLFNAMTGIHHRDLGVAGWALTNDKISCEIIADGVHVDGKMLKLAYKNKGAERLALVSDSVAPAGLGDGDFSLWGERISVVNGATKNERGSIAGSVITLLDAVKTMLRLDISIAEVAKMASLAPAKMLGIDALCGSIETGKRADLTAIDERGNVCLTVIGGRFVRF